MAQLVVLVKIGGSPDISLQCCGDTSIAQLKLNIESLTGIFARKQKLIHKGKVLDDKATLTSSRVENGAKLMLLAGQAGPPKVISFGVLPGAVLIPGALHCMLACR